MNDRHTREADMKTNIVRLLAENAELKRERDEARKQRDEMARAIIRFNSGTCCLPYLVDLALQSLNQTTP